MELAEKLRRLRQAEGVRRGLWRPMTQQEVISAMRREIGVSLSQAYLSQLEGGRRLHLSSATREALARFYHVHPGYLLSDPLAVTQGATPVITFDAFDDFSAGPTGALSSTPAPDALLTATLARLAATPDPERALRLLDWLLRLAPDELAALEQHMTTSATAPATRTPEPEPARRRAR